MSSEIWLQNAKFNRPPRLSLPALPQEPIEIPAPPPPVDLPEQSVWITLLPVLGIAVMAIFYLLRAGADPLSSSAVFAIPMLLLAFFTLGGTIIAHRWRRKNYEKRQIEAELNYQRALARRQAQLHAAREAQQALLALQYPGPETLLRRALRRERLWERRPEDDDFLGVRVGLGRITSSVPVTVARAEPEPPGLARAHALADAYRVLEDTPVVLDLGLDAPLGWAGRRAQALPALRACLAQMALSHAPQDLQLYLIAPPSTWDEWRWLKWLPHSARGEHLAAEYDTVRSLLGRLSEILDERRAQEAAARLPHLLIIVDGPELVESEAVYQALLREGLALGVSVICLANTYAQIPGECRAVLELLPEGRFRLLRPGGETPGTLLDRIGSADAEHLARAMSGVILQEPGSSGRIPQRVDFLEMYGARTVEDLALMLRGRWGRPVDEGALPYPVPIGRESLTQNTEIWLDEDHHGPHGVIAGTTGAGKSELMQTLVTAMAIEHDPRLVNFMLIDFKGGSTFNVFERLPHVVGLVTNLDGVRVRRVLEALKAETEARQLFLQRMNVRDIVQYHRYYTRTPQQMQASNYQPLPHLFIIVDEFAQLAKEMPEFLRELVRTVQLGRSLGLHLILGTQSPMDVITDEMNANLQFRICLRVQNVEASRAVLRRPDAAFLPAGTPGRGYFQVGERALFKLFQTAYVGADYLPSGQGEREALYLELINERGERINLMPDIRTSYPGQDDPALAAAQEAPSVAAALVEAIADYAAAEQIPPLAPLLLPPLADRITLAAPLGKCNVGGFDGRAWREAGSDHEGQPLAPGSAPIGLLDDVYNRTQHPLWAHLGAGRSRRRKEGHLLLVGGPGTGKTSALRSLALSLAILHPPDDLHLYILSYTGSGLDDLGDLPHAERVIHGGETERIRRLFGRLIAALDERQQRPNRDPRPLIVLLIDQFEQFRDACRETHLKDFERLVHEGRAVGIAVALTASSAAAVPERFRSLIEQRIALGLSNPADVAVLVGRLGALPPGDLPPGRGHIYHHPPLLCQLALPSRAGGALSDAQVNDALRGLIHQMRRAYAQNNDREQAPAPIRELPQIIAFEEIEQPASDGLHTALGFYDDTSITPFVVDWGAAGPHFVVTGPPGSGKTNLLHAAALAAAAQFPPETLRFLLVDFAGRSLRPLERLKHSLARLSDANELRQGLAYLAGDLAAPEAAQVATVLLIDDYDLMSEALGFDPEPLRILRDLLRRHSDAALHLWAATTLERSSDPLLRHLLLRRSGFAFGHKEYVQRLNARSHGLPEEFMPEGRAFYVHQNAAAVVQIARVEDVSEAVQAVNLRWQAHDDARWLGQPQAVSAPPSEAAAAAAAYAEELLPGALEIDTGGLLNDLLGELGEIDEGGAPS